MSKAIFNNPTAKAVQAKMAKEKKYNHNTFLEWEVGCNTSPERGHVFSQHELMQLYSRKRADGDCGATKVCHTYSHTGFDFEYIVIKRAHQYAHVFYGEGTGNQLVDEIACWKELANKPEADYLCPILKYFTSKSDKVEADSKKMFNNVMIIAQKAVFVSDLIDACEEAERRNREIGKRGTPKYTRYDEMVKFSKERGWRDAIHNCGNSGVIFDYSQGCYKAVFIDYAL